MTARSTQFRRLLHSRPQDWRARRALAVVSTLAALSIVVGAEADLVDATDPSPLEEAGRGGPRLGLGWRVQGGAIHQFESSIDGGGKVSTTRAVFEVGARWAFTEKDSVGLAVAYALDDYAFTQGAQIAGLSPWNDVHALRISAPIFFEPRKGWEVLTIPTFRMSAERAQDWGNAISGGLIAGFSYKFGDRLKIGPGFGVIAEVEDDVDVFPVILIDWRIRENLWLETGGGLGATRGPGVLLNWEPRKWWRFSAGFRREKYRFRLSPNASIPGGVGEESSFPILGGVTFGPVWAQASLIVGVEVGGELQIDDARGRKIAESDFDPAPFVGFTFRLYL